MSSEIKFRLEKAIENSFPLSIRLLKKMEEVNIEIGRRAKLADMLIKIGAQKNDIDIIKILKKVLEEQRGDGGWGSVEESLICLRFISNYNDKNVKNKIERAKEWLFANQNKDGGWGRCVRDRSRIPMTFRIIELFYNLDIKENIEIKKAYMWMGNEWKKDIKFSGLSYKASGILITNKLYNGLFSDELIEKTLTWLIKDQNKDGGWGPNKYSPIGSTSIYTSLVISALINYWNEKTDKSIQSGIEWVLSNQLQGGQWKEHPPEDGIISCLETINKILKLNKY